MFDFRNVLVTGGAGFVGSNLAVGLKQAHPEVRVIAADNLRRRGSETNLARLRTGGVEFLHADIRSPEDLETALPKIDLVLECSAEPSVLAGHGESPEYVLRTNLVGTVNCLEFARKREAAFVFLSTSRVYPTRLLNEIETEETETRLKISKTQRLVGISPKGISEDFPLGGARSLYGATKLASELLIGEYADMYSLRAIINRCGVIAGPYQFGKVEQGVFALWVASHYFGKAIAYHGWGGEGKQVRDLLHIDDLAELLSLQLGELERFRGLTFNVGGGLECSLSLREATALCRELTGNTVSIGSEPSNRPADVKLYVSDTDRIREATGWRPKRSPRDILHDTLEWIRASEHELRGLWA